jgi:ribosomal-protein-alanine N-acetyltransferase
VTNEALADEAVVLREWRDDDADWYAEAVRDEQIQRFPTEPDTLTAADVKDGIAKLRENKDAAGYVICDTHTGERLGNIAIARAGDVADASYWVAAGGRGRGVASRALQLICAWAEQAWQLTEIELKTHADNVASQRVAERAGFVRAPERDGEPLVKAGETWPTTAYVRRSP